MVRFTDNETTVRHVLPDADKAYKADDAHVWRSQLLGYDGHNQRDHMLLVL